ncbi:hypothetical protein E3Q19_02831 [Wallemia mellicola]|nr:hypothetical protein E3Q19_02831 [Wallemia mellicola]TIC72840.1 hypothetical protein E3Q00_03564 [Wallemia mellicola]
MPKIALVFGATGISGQAVIDVLLKDSSYERVIGISRRPIDRKGVVHISIDLDVSKACPNLKSFHLQTGYKYYMPGFTAEEFPPLPFKEDSKRQAHVHNFYYHQEDKLAAVTEDHGWNWTVSRPCAIPGYSKGNWMSVSVTAALYAFGCKEFDEKLHYPGPLVCYDMGYDNSTAKNNAEFQLYAVENAHNRAFSINYGKPYQFSTLWP